MSVKKKRLYKKISKDIAKLYSFFGNYPQSIPSEIGLKQFAEFEHSKIHPLDPDLYFLHLKTGKVWYNLQIETYRKMYNTGDWPGWHLIKHDYKDSLWIIKYLFNWIKYPEWVDAEEKKQQEKHWYKIYYGECPVCGHFQKYKVRIYGEKPKDLKEVYKRLSNEECYDFCIH